MRILIITILFAFSQSSFAQQQKPCDSDAHRQFDFWVGEWDVYKYGTDTIVGQNTIRSILNGCVVEENWTSATGWKGKSFNTYNPADSTWNQVWVDQSGNTYHFSGRREGNVMKLAGKATSKGQHILFEMSYYFEPEKGTVRQLWKMSKDDGESWQLAFDGLYRKK